MSEICCTSRSAAARGITFLPVDVAPRLATLKVIEPSKRKAGAKVADAKALVDKLRNEAKVL